MEGNADGLALLGGLPPFQRILLTTDGTVTTILAAHLGEPIGIELLGQEVVTLEHPDSLLEVGIGRKILCRRVLLFGTSSGLLLMHAQSRLVLDRLSKGIQAALLGGESAIGLILRKHRVETFRTPIDTGLHWAGPEVAGSFGRAIMCYRTYTIISSAEPLMVVHEEFPCSGFFQRPLADVARPAPQASCRADCDAAPSDSPDP